MLVCVSSHNFAHETAGAARTRHSLLPLLGEGGTLMNQLAQIVRRDRGTVPRTSLMRSPLTTSFRGAPLGREPGIHTHDRGYGFRAQPCGLPRNDGCLFERLNR